MFNTLRELAGGVGTGQAATNAATGGHANDDGVVFDEEAAGADFGNQLQAVPMGATITQPQGVDADVLTLPLPPPPPQQQQRGVGVSSVGGAQHQQAMAVYSGIDAALCTLGHTMYDPGAIDAELAIQSGINPADAASRSAFRDFAVNVQKFRVYIAMLGGQPYVSMIHTPGVYYSIDALTSAYQGKVLVFVGDRRATKEPTPVCLPSTKAWEWHTGDANTDFAKLEEYYATNGNKSSLWRPGANDGAVATVKVPNLLEIPNALVDLHRTQGAAITPHDVLATVDDFLQSSHYPPGNQWDCVRKWCLVACQAGPLKEESSGVILTNADGLGDAPIK
jgi:hypothetical protein